MNCNEYKIKINAKQADNYQVMRAMTDKNFVPYAIWNAAKAIEWTIKTGRISAIKERKLSELTGIQTVELVYQVAEQAEEITLASASKALIAII